MSQTYTIKQVAEILGYSTNSIYSFVKEGRIRGTRVGKGRFRISQEELNRVLHLSKNTQFTPAVQTPKPLEKTVSSSPSLTPHLRPVNIFDWFFGINSILLGLSFFLESRLFIVKATILLSTIIIPIQVIFIISGFGILITNFSKKHLTGWHILFSILASLDYIGLSLMLLYIGGTAGAVLFLCIGIVGIVDFFTKHTRLSFLLLLFLYPLALTIISLFYSINIVVTAGQKSSTMNFINTMIYLSFTLFYFILLTSYIRETFSQKKSLLNQLTFLSTLIIVGVSIYYINTFSWIIATTFLLIGLICFFLPDWDNIHWFKDEERNAIIGIFFGIFILLSLGILVIRIIQQNIIEYAQTNVVNSVSIGKFWFNSTLEDIHSSIDYFSRNTVLIDAFRKKDNSILTGLSRAFVEANPVIFQMSLYDNSGSLIVNYPYSGDNSLIGCRQIENPDSNHLFIICNQTNSSTTIFYKQTVFDNDDQEVGEIIASVNNSNIQQNLEQLINVSTNGYYILTDTNDKPIMTSQDSSFIQNLGKSFPIASMIPMTKKTSEIYQNGVGKVLATYDVLPQFGWKIIYISPLINIFNQTNIVLMFVYLMVALIVISEEFLLRYLKKKNRF